VIRSRLALLRVQKEQAEGRKLPYRVIAEEAKISTGVLTRLMNNEFDRVDVATLDALCRFFACNVGDLLEYVPSEA
jgi:putative transcriptional regulator